MRSGIVPVMRIWRHGDHGDHGDNDHDREPVWTAGKPVWTEVHIEAPKAASLAKHEIDASPHRAA